MRDDDAPDDRYTDLLAQLLEEIDTLDRQRGQLSQARTLAVNQLLSHLGVSRKALAAFLARRKLSEEARAHYDASLSELCNLDDAPPRKPSRKPGCTSPSPTSSVTFPASSPWPATTGDVA